MRENVTVFIDAVYLYTFGSLAVTGSKLPRIRVGVKSDVLCEQLKEVIQDVAPGRGLLRIYWYDVATSNRLHEEAQIELCSHDQFKLRPVALHNHIVKTGIASTIVKDMSDLAQNSGTSDCLVVARNDLLRPGIEYCQMRGVRVHLLEVYHDSLAKDSRLLTDMDSCRSWAPADLSRVLYERNLPKQDNQDAYFTTSWKSSDVRVNRDQMNEEVPEQLADSISACVRRYVESLHQSQLEMCESFWASGRTGVPSEHDKDLLNECRAKIDRNLTNNERLIMRRVFREMVLQTDGGDTFPEDEDFEYEDLYDENGEYDETDDMDDSTTDRPY